MTIPQHWNIYSTARPGLFGKRPLRNLPLALSKHHLA
jgi:hypothetical protein